MPVGGFAQDDKSKCDHSFTICRHLARNKKFAATPKACYLTSLSGEHPLCETDSLASVPRWARQSSHVSLFAFCIRAFMGHTPVWLRALYPSSNVQATRFSYIDPGIRTIACTQSRPDRSRIHSSTCLRQPKDNAARAKGRSGISLHSRHFTHKRRSIPPNRLAPRRPICPRSASADCGYLRACPTCSLDMA